MKAQLNEVQKLQKIAGILKENINEAPLTINQVVKQLNKIANSKGFYAVDKSADEKPKKGASGVNNLVKWEDADDNFVELFYNKPYGSEVTVDDLEINFDAPNFSGNDPVDQLLDPSRWDEAFTEEESTYYDDEDNKDAEDPLYDELVNKIGEKTLLRLLIKGWEIDNIAQDPQGAAASLKK